MRVLLVTGSFPPMPCGVGDYTHRLARSLADQPGVSVGVLTSTQASAQASGAELEILPIMSAWGVSSFPRALRAIRDWKPDIVHVQIPTQGYVHGILPSLIPTAGWLSGARIVQTWHEYMRSKSLREALEHLLRCVGGGGVVFVRPDFIDRMLPLWRWVVRIKVAFEIRSASSIRSVQLNPQQAASVRRKFSVEGKMMVVHFGFPYRKKGTHQLFEIVDPERFHLVITGMCDPDDDYQQHLRSLASAPRWRGSVTFTGFLEEGDVGQLLAAADAVVLPFLDGGGEWNTSLLAAQAAGAFVVTTSTNARGFAAADNIFYSPPGAVEEMRGALNLYAGRMRDSGPRQVRGWDQVAKSHILAYECLLRRSRGVGGSVGE